MLLGGRVTVPRSWLGLLKVKLITLPSKTQATSTIYSKQKEKRMVRWLCPDNAFDFRLRCYKVPLGPTKSWKRKWKQKAKPPATVCETVKVSVSENFVLECEPMKQALNESFLRSPRRSVTPYFFFHDDLEEDRGILPVESRIAIRSALNSETRHPFFSQISVHDSSGKFARSRSLLKIK